MSLLTENEIEMLMRQVNFLKEEAFFLESRAKDLRERARLLKEQIRCDTTLESGLNGCYMHIPYSSPPRDTAFIPRSYPSSYPSSSSVSSQAQFATTTYASPIPPPPRATSSRATSPVLSATSRNIYETPLYSSSIPNPILPR